MNVTRKVSRYVLAAVALALLSAAAVEARELTVAAAWGLKNA
jgi:hypothetical protein